MPDLPSTEYPGVQSVTDSITRYALRILHDLRQRLERRAIPEEITFSSTSPLPVLGADDAGRLYHARNFARVFRWTGSRWEFAPGQVPRGVICWFVSVPGAGWARCDGGIASSPSETGVMEGLETPVVPDAGSARAWIKL